MKAAKTPISGMGTDICTVDDCPDISDTRGMCSKHYRRWLRNGTTDRKRLIPGPCVVEGCGREHSARGLCESHYKRWQRHHDPMVRLIKGCIYPGCVGRVAVDSYCEQHARPVELTGTAATRTRREAIHSR